MKLNTYIILQFIILQTKLSMHFMFIHKAVPEKYRFESLYNLCPPKKIIINWLIQLYFVNNFTLIILLRSILCMYTSVSGHFLSLLFL